MRSATQELTIFAEIDQAQRPELDRRLAKIAADLEGNDVFRPSSISDTHFMRFVIIDDPVLPALLAWEINHDGDAHTYVAKLPPSIDHIFECCVGYTPTARATWLLQHRQRAAAFYTAYPGVPHREIVNDLAVHDAIREVADRDRAQLVTLPHHEIQRRLREAAAAKQLETSHIPDEDLRWVLDRGLAFLGAAILFIPLLVIIVPWFVILRTRETAEEGTRATRPVHAPSELVAVEDQIRQNQLTHVVDIKPGRFRMFTVWSVLHVIGVLASVCYVNGHLGGITSIHFARWVIVKDPRSVPRAERRDRLVFFSNYDGSWESYLGEFIDRASIGLTAIWSNTEGFPRAKYLMLAGATNEEAFKQWTRDHQRPTQVWWSGVPRSTVQNVRDDIWLRRRLDQTLDRKEMTAWLRRV